KALSKVISLIFFVPLKEFFPGQMGAPYVTPSGLQCKELPFVPYHRIAVVVPDRTSDGYFRPQTIWIPQHVQRYVSIGQPVFSQRNVLKFAFNRLGDPYAWGGEYGYADCASFVRDVYGCFGIKMPYDTTRILALPVRHDRIGKFVCGNDRKKMLDNLPAGAIIHLLWHNVLYLGQHEGEYYTLSSVFDVVRVEDNVRTSVNGISIFPLSTKRLSGLNWLLTIFATTLVQEMDEDKI
ncbi:MAG: C40 family peptidase, partial [Enterococcus sp.]|nr:C40 family peptidase [Enterococcus sp.]